MVSPHSKRTLTTTTSFKATSNKDRGHGAKPQMQRQLETTCYLLPHGEEFEYLPGTYKQVI